MSNGNLLAADWEFQLHNTLYGRATNGVSLDATASPPVDGLGVPDTKSQDVESFGQSGAYPNPDYSLPRVITLAVIIRSTASTAGTTLVALNTAWQPVTSDTDLGIQLPGYKFYVNGRPRGLKPDMKLHKFGVIRALLRFDCVLDPSIHAL